jgi:hypothetical protein
MCPTHKMLFNAKRHGHVTLKNVTDHHLDQSPSGVISRLSEALILESGDLNQAIEQFRRIQEVSQGSPVQNQMRRCPNHMIVLS